MRVPVYTTNVQLVARNQFGDGWIGLSQYGYQMTDALPTLQQAVCAMLLLHAALRGEYPPESVDKPDFKPIDGWIEMEESNESKR